MIEAPSSDELIQMIMDRRYHGEQVSFSEFDTSLPINLQNDSTNVLNIYLFGSRLYKCHKPESDFDFIAIVGGTYFNASKLLETETININVYHIDYIRHLIREHVIWVLMLLSKHFPEENVVLKRVDLALGQQLDLNRLKKMVLMDSSNNIAKAKRYCVNREWRDESVFKKNIVHCVRHLLLGLQMYQFGEIVDYACANDVYNDVMNENKVFESVTDEWKHYEQKYKEMIDGLMHDMKYAHYTLESLPIDQITFTMRKQLVSTDSILNYVKQNGLDSLIRDFSFHVTRPFVDSRIIVCNIDQEYTQMFNCNSSVGRDFQSVVLKESGDDYRVVATLPSMVTNQYDSIHDSSKIFDHMDLTQLSSYFCYGGFDTLLFNSNDQWFVHFPVVTRYRFHRNFHVHMPEFQRVAGTEMQQDLQLLSSLFWETWENEGYQTPSDNSRFYQFEFCVNHTLLSDFLLLHTTQRTDNNQIIFRRAYSLNRSTLESDFNCLMNWNSAPPSAVVDVSSMHLTIASRDPLACRSIVIIDELGMNQVEFVNPQVEALLVLQYGHLLQPQSIQRCLEQLIRTGAGQTDHIFEHKKWKDQQLLSQYQTIKARYCEIIDHFDSIVAKLSETHKRDKRQFASDCKKFTKHSHIVFDMFNSGGISPADYFRTCHYKVFKKVFGEIRF